MRNLPFTCIPRKPRKPRMVALAETMEPQRKLAVEARANMISQCSIDSYAGWRAVGRIFIVYFVSSLQQQRGVKKGVPCQRKGSTSARLKRITSLESCLPPPFSRSVCLCLPPPPPPAPSVGSCGRRIKVPSDENTELTGSPFKAWSRSVRCHACYAHCQGFRLC